MKIVRGPRRNGKFEEDELRNRREFLFFPKTIIQKELKIMRWLEFAEWTERWNYRFPATAKGLDAPDYALKAGNWTATKWLDIEETAFQVIRDLGQEPHKDWFGLDPLNQKGWD